MVQPAKHAVALITVLMAVSGAPARADAQADAKKEARKHFDRAMELIDDGQVAEAAIEFKRSYDLRPHYAVLYNLGQAYIELAKPVEALDALQRYLKEGGKNIKPDRRAEVERDIARQEIRIATLDIKVSPEGATVRVDDAEIGKAPLPSPVSVGIGEHVVSATADGHEPATTKVAVAGEDRKTVELTLNPIPEPKAEAPAPPVATSVPAIAPAPLPPPSVTTPPAEATSPWLGVGAAQETAPAAPPSTGLNGLQVAGIVSAAAGLVGFVTAIACWSTAQDRHESAVTYWNRGGDSDAKANQLQSEARDYAIATTVSLVAGSILAAGGIGLYLGGMARERDQPAPVSALRVPILPAVGPGFAGLSTRGTW
jgi:hypothetical protein